jgi:hypothetical protein
METKSAWTYVTLQQANQIKLNKAKPYQQGVLGDQKSSYTYRNHILHYNQHSTTSINTCITGNQIPFLYQNKQWFRMMYIFLWSCMPVIQKWPWDTQLDLCSCSASPNINADEILIYKDTRGKNSALPSYIY